MYWQGVMDSTGSTDMLTVNCSLKAGSFERADNVPSLGVGFWGYSMRGVGLVRLDDALCPCGARKSPLAMEAERRFAGRASRGPARRRQFPRSLAAPQFRGYLVDCRSICIDYEVHDMHIGRWGVNRRTFSVQCWAFPWKCLDVLSKGVVP